MSIKPYFHLIFVLSAAVVSAQTPSALECFANSGIPPVVRSEGTTELVGDLVLLCGGGQAGQNLTVDLTLTLNVPVTSPVRSGSSDALVLINEPNTGDRPALQPGVNAFRAAGSGTAANVLKFNSVPITVPPSDQTLVLRFTNIQVNASAAPTPDIPGVPAQVTVAIGVAPAGVLSIANPSQIMALAQPGLRAELRSAADGQFSPIVLNPETALNAGLLQSDVTGAAPQFLIRFEEGLSTAFRARGVNGGISAVAAQKQPGSVYFSETGLYDPQLSATGEWNKVGLADNGTRLMARFSGIPAGASVFVSTTPWPVGTLEQGNFPALTTATAKLAATDANGAGAFTPSNDPAVTTQIAGRSVGLARLTAVNGSATAVWEITDSPETSAFVIDRLAFSVFIAYHTGTITPSAMKVDVSLAPTATAVPRFSGATSLPAVVISGAGQLPDLVPAVTPQSTTVISGTNFAGTAGVTNSGSGPLMNTTKVAVQLFTDAAATVSASQPYSCTIAAGLQAGASSASCAWVLFGVTNPGTYYLRARVDPNGDINESNEANNTIITPVTVEPCSLKMPAAVFIPSNAGTKSVPVVTGTGCVDPATWAVNQWLTARYEPFSKPGYIDLVYAANPLGASRTDTVTLSGQTMAVTQAPAGCTYSVSPKSVYLAMSGGLYRGEAQVNTAAHCPWVPVWTASWLTVSAIPDKQGATYIGPGTMQLTAPANAGAARTAVVSVASQDVSVAQASSSDTTPPFGSFDVPAQNASNLVGAINVSGWALDDTYVSRIEVWRAAVPGDVGYPGFVYIGPGIFLEGARPDVAATYPTYPFRTRAGWGMQILTNMLPGSGNGPYTLRILAYDQQGNSTVLGTRTIYCNNAAAAKPFGTIATPASGQTVSGLVTNFGWALTQNPHEIPKDGSTMWVFVDGRSIGHPTYNQFRPDIATLFPGRNNSDGAVGYFHLDTTALSDGMHTIAWSVTDNGGRIEGIGSRLFWVNNGVGLQAATASPKTGVRSAGFGQMRMRTGYDPNAPLMPVEDVISLSQSDRLELHLAGDVRNGCLAVGEECRELPAGSTLEDGVFYWQLHPAYRGEYELRFGDQRVRVKVE